MTYSITTDLSVQLLQSIDADDHMVTLALTFDVRPPFPETRIQPGEPASVEVLTATVVEHIGVEALKYEAPAWLWRMIEADEALEGEMLAEAWESDEAARDDRADMLREERLLECRAAQGIEAGTAETVEQGSVHESPVGKADAPNLSDPPRGEIND